MKRLILALVMALGGVFMMVPGASAHSSSAAASAACNATKKIGHQVTHAHTTGTPNFYNCHSWKLNTSTGAVTTCFWQVHSGDPGPYSCQTS